LQPVGQPGQFGILDLDAEGLAGQVGAQGAGVEGDVVAVQVAQPLGGEDALDGEVSGAADEGGQAAPGGGQPGEDGAQVGVDLAWPS
jgi:hypothetical protein